MSDDKSKRAPEDARLINIHEDYELAYWSEKWRVTRDSIREAVGKVGTSVSEVAKYLKKAP